MFVGWQYLYGINLFLALILSKMLIDAARAYKGKSLGNMLTFMAVAFLAFAAYQMTGAFKGFEVFKDTPVDWDFIHALSETSFIIIMFIALASLKESLRAYQHLLKKRP
ncbi:MAG: hypothetical protein AB1468_06670 [Candidatus Micrarchaeota archaeon]